jgi:predicted O-methyltransferase YrrM
LNIFFKIYKPKTYVELGLYQGETIRKVRPHANFLYGVDMKPNHHLDALKTYPNINIIYSTTDEFFKNNPNLFIDMAFIDADHCVESCQKDLENVLQRLNSGGVVILHDTDPINDALIDPGFCGDSYKIVNILENREDLNILTLPLSEPGLSVVTRKQDSRKQRRDKK